MNRIPLICSAMQNLASEHTTEARSDAVRQLFLRGAVPAPIFLFRLGLLGIDANAFLRKFASCLSDLPWDLYDVLYRAETVTAKSDPDGFSRYVRQRQTDKGPDCQLDLLRSIAGAATEHSANVFRPHRRRAAARYELHRKSHYLWSISDLPHQSFTQSVGDDRVRPRRFASLAPDLAHDSGLLALLAFCAEVIRCKLPKVSTLQAVVHVMATYAFTGQNSNPAPEGVHKDGADFVMTALVIDRQNVVGGISQIFAPKSHNLVYEHQLEPGEALFHADEPSSFWHSVSSIKVANESLVTPSFRAILGIDFLIRGTSACHLLKLR